MAKAKKDVATKVLADGLRLPLRRDQVEALRLHREKSTQELKQAEQMRAAALARWSNLVVGALEAASVDTADVTSYTVEAVVDEQGRLFYEYKKQAGATSAAAPVDQQQPAAPAGE